MYGACYYHFSCSAESCKDMAQVIFRQLWAWDVQPWAYVSRPWELWHKVTAAPSGCAAPAVENTDNVIRSLYASLMPHAAIFMRQVNLADLFRLVFNTPSVETAWSHNRRLDCSTDEVGAIVLVSSLSLFLLSPWRILKQENITIRDKAMDERAAQSK